MFAKTLTAGLLGAALLSSAAYAQNPSPSATSPAASSSASSMSHQGQWRSSKLIGVNVYNAQNESLGEISELLTDSSGKIQAAVIGVGGFLGMGQRDVAIPFEKLKFSNEPRSSTTASNTSGSKSSGSSTMAPTTTTGAATSSSSSSANQWYPDHAILNVTKEELKAMPEFKYST